MNIDFLQDGSVDCPLIRIYNCDLPDYQFLYSMIENLIAEKSPFILSDKTTSTSINFEISASNLGVLKTSNIEFQCKLQESEYMSILDLIKPFLENPNEKNGYQWLNESSEISLLLSRTGNW